MAQNQVIALGAGMVFAQRKQIHQLTTQLADQQANIKTIFIFLQNLPRDFNRFNQQYGDSLNDVPIFMPRPQIEQGSDVAPDPNSGSSQHLDAQTSVVGDGWARLS